MPEGKTKEESVSEPGMPRQFSVTVRLDGEDVVTIETAHLAGREIGPDEEWAIRTSALHLLAFIGEDSPVETCPKAA